LGFSPWAIFYRESRSPPAVPQIVKKNNGAATHRSAGAARYSGVPGTLLNSRGEFSLQVEGFSRTSLRIFLFGTGILLLTASSCHRPPSPDVMATVNGKEISRSELEKYYKSTLGDAPQEPSAEQADIVRLNVLRGLIDDEIVQQRAAKLNLAASDEDVNAKLTEWKAPYTQEEFDKQLKQRNLTVDDLKRDIRRNLTRTKLLNKEIESKINITDAEITSYYNANKAAEFNLIEPRYRLAQIIVTGTPPVQGGNAQTHRAPNEAEARKEIQTIHTRLETGEDFAALASQFSENPNSAPNGGDMGFWTETQLRGDPEVYNAITKLRPGQITDSLPMYDNPGPQHKIIGFAIYRLISREAAGQRELNDPRVQQQIRQDLRERKAQLLQNAYFEMLHNQATVRNYFAEQILKMGAQ
jgi:peptidyl-prolyl cis-trans isomerase SurA